MKFIVKQVWQRICIFFFSETSFTSVSGYKFSAAAEVIDRKTTSVCTSAAFCHSSWIFKGTDVFNRKHSCSFTFSVTFSGNQCSAECAHDSGNIGTDCFAVCDFFKASKDGIVVKCSALNNNMFPEFGSVWYFDDFEKCVFYDGVSKSGRDVRYGSAFFLSLLYFRVHKNSTACP